MNNAATVSKSFITAINMCIDAKLASYSFITLGKIVKINDDFTVNIQPEATVRTHNKDNKVIYRKMPIITNIPYLILSPPTNEGEQCILLHFDNPLNGGKPIKQQQNNKQIKYIMGSTKPHALDNCVAICGLCNVGMDTSTDPQTILLQYVKKLSNNLYPPGSVLFFVEGSGINPNDLYWGLWEKGEMAYPGIYFWVRIE